MSYNLILEHVKEKGIVEIILNYSKPMHIDILEKAMEIAKDKDMVLLKAQEWDDGYDKALSILNRSIDTIVYWSLIPKYDDIMYLVIEFDNKSKYGNIHEIFIPYEMAREQDIVNFGLTGVIEEIIEY